MIDLRDKAALQRLAQIVSDIRALAGEMEFLLVGAAARDLLLQDQHGLTAPRRTTDIDLAFSLPDWDTFADLKTRLIDFGLFTPGRHNHRLTHTPTSTPLDLIPFGDIEANAGEIAWPPNGNPVMSVVGYDVALSCAETALLPGKQSLKIVSLPMLALLKLITWEDRHQDYPRKDAADLIFILDSASQAIGIESLFEQEPRLLELEDFDLDQAGAWILGRQAQLAFEQQNDHPPIAIVRALRILGSETDADGALQLIGELQAADPEAARLRLMAFANGLQNHLVLPSSTQ